MIFCLFFHNIYINDLFDLPVSYCTFGRYFQCICTVFFTFQVLDYTQMDESVGISLLSCYTFGFCVIHNFICSIKRIIHFVLHNYIATSKIWLRYDT